jgi:hypothetical protein
MDVKGKDNSKPGYINKNTLKYKASCQVIKEVSDAIIAWRNYEGHGQTNYCNTAPDFCFMLFTFFITADLRRLQRIKELFFYSTKCG